MKQPTKQKMYQLKAKKRRRRKRNQKKRLRSLRTNEPKLMKVEQLIWREELLALAVMML